MNTAMKHTPGPWLVDGFRIDNGFGYTVAVLPNENRPSDSDTTEADAHLIAAAPQMLRALEAIAGYNHIDAEEWEIRFPELRDVISRDPGPYAVIAAISQYAHDAIAKIGGAA